MGKNKMNAMIKPAIHGLEVLSLNLQPPHSSSSNIFLESFLVELPHGFLFKRVTLCVFNTHFLREKSQQNGEIDSLYADFDGQNIPIVIKCVPIFKYIP